MNKHINITPKIKGYIATQANKIVCIYRRTNKENYLISLHYKKQEYSVELGSRFYGRFYPNRCDLSPCGKYFVYFAMGYSEKQYEKKHYCWTAICRPPHLKAEMLFAHKDTWGGGGRFMKKMLYISPGMFPDFTIEKNLRFHKYHIVFEDKIEDGGWTSGKEWELIETQIDPQYGEKYPIPKCWRKTNGKVTLFKHLDYEAYNRSKERNGKQSMGSYDLHHYVLVHTKVDEKCSLNDKEKLCLWADFDSVGNLIVARESEVFIYKNFYDVINKKPIQSFDFETLIEPDNMDKTI